MKNSQKLVGLFALAMLTVPLAGCDDDLEVCTDKNRDGLCDDDQSRYDSDSYLVIDGKKKYYIKEESLVSSGYKSSGSASYKSGIGRGSRSGG
ncbi:MAG: hypothetical protein WB502_06065 [Thermoactinomyces sp.]